MAVSCQRASEGIDSRLRLKESQIMYGRGCNNWSEVGSIEAEAAKSMKQLFQ